MPENDFWVKPEDIPLDLNLLRTYGNDGEFFPVPGDYAIRVYTIDSLNTNFARPCFALSEEDDPSMEDVAGVLEETLHTLLDEGATADDVYRIMGLVQEDELDPDTRDSDGYTPIDPGYCIEGNIMSYEAVPEDSSTSLNIGQAQIDIAPTCAANHVAALFTNTCCTV